MENLRAILRQYWGYESFRPLQAEAMGCVMGGRDSIVVLPTGGGKSLCFQAPAVALPGVAVVVSPLISLMKDQVDALTSCGVRAAAIHSGLVQQEKRQIAADLHGGGLKLLYVSPERLAVPEFITYLRQYPISFIAIDEAHCVSSWGHDFRPEYRLLGSLREAFPGIALHAYTATATQQVRDDIATQLRQGAPERLIGSFDRPNLQYSVQRRQNLLEQVCEVIDRHREESGIIYCIRRREVDELCDSLGARGLRVVPYHAGLDDPTRRRNQEAFIQEEADIVVATVAFGMGIDKSNVRYVIHTGMPKSPEHYQQESGRAGRDGLEAECCLIHSGADFQTWRHFMKELESDAMAVAMSQLRAMQDYCAGAVCRHRFLVNHFGQSFDKDNCGACDICNGAIEEEPDSLVITQKILSCVVRMGEMYGADYTAQVLTGALTERVLERGHNKLTTHGLLRDHDKQGVRDWIEQLVGQGYLEKTGDYNVLHLTPKGRGALRGDGAPRLPKSAAARTRGGRTKVATESWEGVDRGLFDRLRALRRELAEADNLPAYVVFGDAALRDMARRRPSTLAGFLEVHGVGQAKCESYGAEFIGAITGYCGENQVAMDAAAPDSAIQEAPAWQAPRPSAVTLTKSHAWRLFADGKSIDEVAATTGRARSTVGEYLFEFLVREKRTDPAPWVDAATYKRVTEAALTVQSGRLKPVFDELNGEVPYEMIRACLACLNPPE